MPLTVAAPEGAHFALEELASKGGAEKYQDVPILVWDDFTAATTKYGEEGIKNVLDGTSLRVAFQSIARRHKLAGKSDDEIANAQVAYTPGKRIGAPQTPATKGAKMTKDLLTEKPELASEIDLLIANLKSGKISAEDLAAINKG